MFNLSRFNNVPTLLSDTRPPTPDTSAAAAEAAAAADKAAIDRCKAIMDLCSRAGVDEVAMEWFAMGLTAAQVEKLEHAQPIRDRCAAAGFMNRASNYIKAGVTPDEVSENLLSLKVALDPGEINNKFGPDAKGVKSGAAIDYREIYARRRNWSHKQIADR